MILFSVFVFFFGTVHIELWYSADRSKESCVRVCVEHIRIKLFLLLLKFRGVYIYSLMSMPKRVFSESDVFES